MGTSFKKVETGLNFANVAQMLGGGMANVCSNILYEAKNFVRKNGLAKIPHVFMADHSMGGREWTRN